MTISTPIVADPDAPFVQLLTAARSQKLSIAELFQAAESLTSAGHPALASELYKTWIAFNDDSPFLHLACFNHSAALSATKDIAGKIQALRTAIRINPKFGQAHINLGLTLEECGLSGQAVQQWRSFADASADIVPDRINNRLLSLQHIGRVLEETGHLDEAEAALWQAMELQPTRTEAAQHWISLRMRQCKWPVLAPSIYVTPRHFIDSLSSMTLACRADDPLFQMAKAYRYGHRTIGRPADLASFDRPAVRRRSGPDARLRIGYVSSDLRQHAVGFALSEVLELHDKSAVETYAYYCGSPAPHDPTQARIRQAVDHWRDIARLSDLEAARTIAADGIDILVDVNGYTKHARTAVFAYRPAPVIVNFCGYPGTMASPYHHYMIADARIVPPENEIYYTEKVLRIACNQPVDRKRTVSPRPTRAEVGLPEDSFVFASFNGMQKITPACFGRWMAVLAAVPDSVLWLLAGDDSANIRLQQEAVNAGIDPARLIFAGKVPNPDHLARIGLADLFLDTFPYGAHSTAADALTQGLPVLTVPGKGFAARFCASIVAAAGIAELISDDPEDYVRKAVRLAHDRAGLAAIRQSLEDQRETSALRDVPGLTRRLEVLYRQMQDEAERGELPVPDLSNLDLYYEIGAELMAEPVEFETDAAYRQRYLDKLRQWHDFSPIPHDGRLWTAETVNTR